MPRRANATILALAVPSGKNCVVSTHTISHAENLTVALGNVTPSYATGKKKKGQ